MKKGLSQTRMRRPTRKERGWYQKACIPFILLYISESQLYSLGAKKALVVDTDDDIIDDGNPADILPPVAPVRRIVSEGM
jgi:hypothetical protein